jgi:Helix-hairpin-helix motif
LKRTDIVKFRVFPTRGLSPRKLPRRLRPCSKGTHRCQDDARLTYLFESWGLVALEKEHENMSKKSTPRPGAERAPIPQTAPEPALSLAGGSGYRFNGDQVELSAELALSGPAATGHYCLELWATGSWATLTQGEVAAEARRIAVLSLDIPTPLGPMSYRVRGEVEAKIPTANMAYAMSLRLVQETRTGRREVLDEVSFALLEMFPAPHFAGAVSCRIDGSSVVFEVDRIESTRAGNNTSGTLSLELRSAGSILEIEEDRGTALSTFSLAPLTGGYFVGPLLCRAPMEGHPPSNAELFVVLREYTSSGFATRDYRRVQVAQASKSALAEPSESKATESARISVHHGSLEELAGLPGMTTKIAKELIKARPFKSLQDLLEVRGIGKKTLDRLMAHITL